MVPPGILVIYGTLHGSAVSIIDGNVNVLLMYAWTILRQSMVMALEIFTDVPFCCRCQNSIWHQKYCGCMGLFLGSW